MTVRIYERVSTGRQRLDSQHGDLKGYAQAREREGAEVVFYRDKFTGKSIDRPGLKKLLADLRPGDELAVWRLDRLGRTAVGLHQLFERFQQQRVGFVSLRDSLDLKTAAGRLVAGVLASVAAWETEVRGERIQAGLEAKRERVAAGKERWDVGRPKGTGKITPLVLQKAREMLGQKHSMVEVARTFQVSRQALYRALEREREGKSGTPRD